MPPKAPLSAGTLKFLIDTADSYKKSKLFSGFLEEKHDSTHLDVYQEALSYVFKKLKVLEAEIALFHGRLKELEPVLGKDVGNVLTPHDLREVAQPNFTGPATDADKLKELLKIVVKSMLDKEKVRLRASAALQAWLEEARRKGVFSIYA